MLHHLLGIIARKDADVAPPLITDLSQVRVTTYMGFVSFTILVWDHIVTLADEVEYIWKGKKGLLFFLFMLNRYLSPLGFIINLFANVDRSIPVANVDKGTVWTHIYLRSMTVIGINTTALMMLFRIAALYRRNALVVWFVAVCFSVELAVNAWLLSHGTAVVHNRQIHACTMIFDDAVPGWIASGSAYLPLTYDTIVLALTLNKTIGPIRRKTAGKIARVLLRDGILYYSVIFSVNLVLTVMITAAPSGLQNITAQLEYLLTVAMISRITLHLRKQVRARELDDGLLSYKFPTGNSMANVRSRLRFARSVGESTTLGSSDVSVMVQESAVVHDDHGNVLDGDDDYDEESGRAAYTRFAGKKQSAVEEWYELRPPPLALHPFHTRTDFERDVHFDVPRR
ncbi:hypothetical protein BDW22DRAFT_1426307 [Trametopsis cervina]|nr:hypothetical protein BDW22DRAFT_1426307 [Trametopsis cervina]